MPNSRARNTQVKNAQASIPTAPVAVVEKTVEEVATAPVQKAPEVNRDKSVKAINNGARYVVNLAGYGYGGAWPSKAVYTIPMGVFMDCVKNGANLAMVA